MSISARLQSIAVLLGLATSVSAQGVEYATEPLDHVKAKVEAKKAVLADVRERAEWEKGHLRHAMFLPLSRLRGWERDGITDSEKAELEKTMPKGSVVYCHCAAGARAVPGAKALKNLGYDARPLKAGYRSLIDAGFSQADAN